MAQRLRIAWLIMAICMLVSCSGSAADSSTTALPTQPASSATATAATATAKPRITDPAVLGSPEATFEARFGKPNDHSEPNMGGFHFSRYPDSNEDKLIIQAQAVAPERVIEVLVQAPPDHAWDLTTAQANCMVFAPTDAQYVKQVVVTDSAGAEAVDRVYFSASLALLFPTSAFTDANQNPVKPGSFDIQYLYHAANDPDQIDSCSLALGTQGTQ